MKKNYINRMVAIAGLLSGIAVFGHFSSKVLLEKKYVQKDFMQDATSMIVVTEAFCYGGIAVRDSYSDNKQNKLEASL